MMRLDTAGKPIPEAPNIELGTSDSAPGDEDSDKAFEIFDKENKLILDIDPRKVHLEDIFVRLSLRDYFAGQALTNACSGPGDILPENMHITSGWCYLMADAMLEARKK